MTSEPSGDADRPLTIVFFGSGPFALPVLERLSSVAAVEPAYRLALTVTRPACPAGRGRKVRPNPVQKFAEARQLEFIAPPSANAPGFLDSLDALRPDLFIVCDYGEFLGKPFRTTPRIGSYNLHASLLPKYRGAAPVAHALLNGERTTGVTLFRIVREMDAGPVVDAVEVAIGPDETAGDLEARLAVEAAGLLERNLPRFAAGTFSETAQDESSVSYAPKLRKEQGAIDWSRAATEIECQVRGLHPWPGAYSFLGRDGEPERIRFLRVRAVEAGEATSPAIRPGQIADVDDRHLAVASGDGLVEVLELQRPGKAALSTADFLRGYPLRRGDRFGG